MSQGIFYPQRTFLFHFCSPARVSFFNSPTEMTAMLIESLHSDKSWPLILIFELLVSFSASQQWLSAWYSCLSFCPPLTNQRMIQGENQLRWSISIPVLTFFLGFCPDLGGLITLNFTFLLSCLASTTQRLIKFWSISPVFNRCFLLRF